jgi:hypothetical protein
MVEPQTSGAHVSPHIARSRSDPARNPTHDMDSGSGNPLSNITPNCPRRPSWVALEPSPISADRRRGSQMGDVTRHFRRLLSASTGPGPRLRPQHAEGVWPILCRFSPPCGLATRIRITGDIDLAMGRSFVENIATHHHDPAVATLAERGQDSPPPAGGGPEASPIRDCKAVPRGHCNQWAGRRTQRLGSPSARRRRRCVGADDATSPGSAPSLPFRAQARRSCGWFVRDSGWSSRGRWAARHIGGPTSPLGRTPQMAPDPFHRNTRKKAHDECENETGDRADQAGRWKPFR